MALRGALEARQPPRPGGPLRQGISHYVTLHFMLRYIILYRARRGRSRSARGRPKDAKDVRPISLLTLRLLTLLDSNFPGNPLWAWEFLWFDWCYPRLPLVARAASHGRRKGRRLRICHDSIMSRACLDEHSELGARSCADRLRS